nr:EOG090X0AVC [Polyphemus pediculus]
MMYPDDENIDDLFGDIDKRNNSDRSDQSQDEEDDEIGVEKRKAKDDDEGEEEDGQEAAKKKKRQAGPRKITNPRLKLDADRICGPRGIMAVQETFKTVHLGGKGNEKKDLDMLLKKLEHWAHRLFPKMSFGDCIEQVEKLGSKKGVQTYMKKIRMDLIDTHIADGDVVDKVGLDAAQRVEPVKDAFDDLLAHYSNKPAASSSSEPSSSLSLTQNQQDRIAKNKRKAEEKRRSRVEPVKDAFDDLLAHYSNKPAASSSSEPSSSLSLTQNQQDRIAKNKRKAEEKRRSRMLELNRSQQQIIDIPDDMQ